jgi:hypothetical protein
MGNWTLREGQWEGWVCCGQAYISHTQIALKGIQIADQMSEPP